MGAACSRWAKPTPAQARKASAAEAFHEKLVLAVKVRYSLWPGRVSHHAYSFQNHEVDKRPRSLDQVLLKLPQV